MAHYCGVTGVTADLGLFYIERYFDFLTVPVGDGEGQSGGVLGYIKNDNTDSSRPGLTWVRWQSPTGLDM